MMMEPLLIGPVFKVFFPKTSTGVGSNRIIVHFLIPARDHNHVFLVGNC